MAQDVRVSGQLQLLIAQRWEDHLAEEIPSWFETVAAAFALKGRPLVALTPSREVGFYLKSKLISGSQGFAGIHFWTPAQCRTFLLEHLDGAPSIIQESNAGLLLSALAAQQEDEPVMRSIAADPGALLQTVEKLLRACGNLEPLEGPAVRRLAEQWLSLLQEAGLILTAQADHWLLEQTHTSDSGQTANRVEPVIDSLLVYGFDGSRWPLWPLLFACARFAKETTVCLVQPRHAASELDQNWINSWEEAATDSRQIGESDQSPRDLEKIVMGLESAAEAQFLKSRESSSPDDFPQGGPVRYLIGGNLREQVEAIARQTLFCLSDPACHRLGILFPGSGPLSREVTCRLAELGIPFFDGIGHARIDGERRNRWSAWLAFQEQPRMGELLELCRQFRQPSRLAHEGLSCQRIESALNDAYREALVDDLRVLESFLERSERKPWNAVAEFLKSQQILPRQAPIHEFLRLTEEAMNGLGLSEGFRVISPRAAGLQFLGETEVRVEVFLRWLREIPVFEERERAMEGDHPFARVHVLSYGQAEAQTWSHLILTDLNHHHWPPRQYEMSFLHEETVAKINAANTITGSQGEGQQIVKPGKSLCLGPNERRALLYRQWIDLIDSAEVAVAATASTMTETEPDRELVPSEYLTRLYLADRRETLGVEAIAQLQTQTAEWLRQSTLRLREDTPDADIQQTGKAFTQRRCQTLAFGEYDFALKHPPEDQQLNLACGDWENAFNCPALAWMNHALGVEERVEPLDQNPWPQTIGIWVHRWLREMLNAEAKEGFFEISVGDDFENALIQAAQKTKAAVARDFSEANLSLPAWWISGWERALRLARQLGRRLRFDDTWKYAATEFTLPNPVQVSLSRKEVLRVHGRLDLILTNQAPGEGEAIHEGSRVWIIDYKTGSMSSLNLRRLKQKGEGIQLGLYALALKALGADAVQTSIAHPESDLQPQLDWKQIEGASRLWKLLCRMQDSWQFGLRGDMRPEFGHVVTYPLATIPIDPGVLKEKWKRTFGD